MAEAERVEKVKVSASTDAERLGVKLVSIVGRSDVADVVVIGDRAIHVALEGISVMYRRLTRSYQMLQRIGVEELGKRPSHIAMQLIAERFMVPLPSGRERPVRLTHIVLRRKVGALELPDGLEPQSEWATAIPQIKSDPVAVSVRLDVLTDALLLVGNTHQAFTDATIAVQRMEPDMKLRVDFNAAIGTIGQTPTIITVQPQVQQVEQTPEDTQAAAEAADGANAEA